jgi:Mg2+/Co2+ transporter CorC
MKSKLNIGAPIGFVVSNSFYGGIIIATDLLIAEAAKKNGYLMEEIVSYRKIVPSSQQFNKILNNHFMRESLVVFRNV